MRNSERTSLACGVLICISLIGCSKSTAPLHSVQGSVPVSKSADLVGSSVELRLVDNHAQRGFGLIEADGRFQIQSLQEGELRDGVPQGTYSVRIIPNDEDRELRRRAEAAIGTRLLRFETSGVTISVPDSSHLSLEL